MPAETLPAVPTAQPERYIRLAELKPLIGLKSTSNIRRLIKAGRFPTPYRIADRAIAWRASDIAAWQENRAAADIKG